MPLEIVRIFKIKMRLELNIQNVIQFPEPLSTSKDIENKSNVKYEY